jgi:hypothetical protein
VAAQAARGKGRESLLGPLSFSTNGECAMLIDGFDDPPAVLMPWNFAYYAGLCEAAGLTKARDLYAFRVANVYPPEAMRREADRVRQRTEVVVRPVNMRRLREEIRSIQAVYHAAWSNNWGFVPLTDREMDQLAADFKEIALPELVLIAEVKGEVVGFSMALPDINPALRAAGGRLLRYGLPIGLLKLKLAARKLTRARFFTLGVKPEYRKEGLGTAMSYDTFVLAHAMGFKEVEVGWTLEDNAMINAHTELFGGVVYKRYRIWEKRL